MKEKILEKEIIEAMKSKNKERLGALKVLKSEIQNEKIKTKSEFANDQIVEKVAELLAKQMSKALAEVENEKNRELLNVCKEFLPKQLNKDELIEKIIKDGISFDDVKNKGQMFGAIKKFIGNKASVETIQEVIETHYEWL